MMGRLTMREYLSSQAGSVARATVLLMGAIGMVVTMLGGQGQLRIGGSEPVVLSQRASCRHDVARTMFGNFGCPDAPGAIRDSSVVFLQARD